LEVKLSSTLVGDKIFSRPYRFKATVTSSRLAWGGLQVRPPQTFSCGRYNTEGTIDSNFGSGSSVMKDMFCLYDQAQSILAQADPACACEKIVVVGADGTGSITTQAVALRYHQ
jgi:hypothetical protein